MSLMTPQSFARCLVDAGILTQDEVNRTSRIVIDCSIGSAVTIYVQRYGDADALAELVPMLGEMIRRGSDTAQSEPIGGA